MLRRLGTATFANAYLLLTLTALFWAGNLVVGRAVAGTVPPVTLSAIRWLISAVIILPFAWVGLRRDWPLAQRHWPILVLLFLISAYHVTLNYVALNYTTALNTLALSSISPILIVLICWALFGELISARQLLGIVTSFSGALAIIFNGTIETLLGLSFNVGDLIVVFAMSILALYTAVLRRRPAIHWLSFTALLYVSGFLFNLPFAVLEHVRGERFAPTPEALAAIAYVAIFPSLIAYILFNRGVELIGGQRAGAFMHLVPLFGAALAIAFLGERLALFHVVGFVLIVSGVALAARPA